MGNQDGRYGVGGGGGYGILQCESKTGPKSFYMETWLKGANENRKRATSVLNLARPVGHIACCITFVFDSN